MYVPLKVCGSIFKLSKRTLFTHPIKKINTNGEQYNFKSTCLTPTDRTILSMGQVDSMKT